MNRQQVREFVEAAANNLGTGFNSGRVSEFNSERTNTYPFVWLESLSRSSAMSQIQMPVDTWAIIIHVMKLDSPGSTPAQYEGIVDECDTLAQKIVRLLNQELSGYKLTQINSILSRPDIHNFADNLSGVILSFDLVSPDTTDIC